MEKWYSGREFVAARYAKRRSGFVHTAIADSGIAVRLAGPKFGVNNDVPPTSATSGVWRDGSIIATGNVRTGNVTRRLA